MGRNVQRLNFGINVNTNTIYFRITKENHDPCCNIDRIVKKVEYTKINYLTEVRISRYWTMVQDQLKKSKLSAPKTEKYLTLTDWSARHHNVLPAST